MSRSTVLPLIAALAILGACGQQDQAEPPIDAPAATETEAHLLTPDAGPPQLTGAGAPESTTTEPVARVGLLLDLPDGWQSEPPSSGMRAAQARIPGTAGDAEFVLFYFGPGQGGDTEANIERWIGQMEVQPGTSPDRQSFETNGLRVSSVRVDGTLKASGMGMGPTVDQPGFRLLGAVLEGPGGPWFIKVTGPVETLEAEQEAFEQMIRGVRLEGDSV